MGCTAIISLTYNTRYREITRSIRIRWGFLYLNQKQFINAFKPKLNCCHDANDIQIRQNFVWEVSGNLIRIWTTFIHRDLFENITVLCNRLAPYGRQVPISVDDDQVH